MAIVLFDNNRRNRLFPLSLTRAVADIRFGIFTMKERWERILNEPVYILTESYLQNLYGMPPAGEHVWIDAAVVPDTQLVSAVRSLTTGSGIKNGDGWIAGRTDVPAATFQPDKVFALCTDTVQVNAECIVYPWHLMQRNDVMIRFDYALITEHRSTQPIPSTVQTIHPEDIFIEEGARLSFCTLNASTGPIYIGKDAEVMEGSSIRGPFVLGENSVLKMNSRVYGATTLGPSCMGGGEIKNSVMMANSNKAHDGYLGDSVVGEWCNFGAGSSNSNLKNTAGEVKVWSMSEKTYLPVGRKCGVIMGDYSRVAINSSINTGTVIGVSSHVFGAGLYPTIIGNFKWGTSGTAYEFEKALQDIGNWKNLKGQSLGDTERSVLKTIFEQEAGH